MPDAKDRREGPAGPPLDTDAVRRANRTIYDGLPAEQYERNPSIFCPARQRALRQALQALAARTGGGALLDVGCGTGNVLRMARGLFRERVGVDLGRGVLRAAKARDPEAHVSLADGARLPFADRRFDCVTCYGVLHHLRDPAPALEEAYRVLRPGGRLYTDHDVNYYFGRFWRLARRVRDLGRRGYDMEAIAEYQNTVRGGVHPGRIERILRGLGFSEVEIRFRHTVNPGLSRPGRLAVALARAAARRIPLRSLYTHFSAIASK